MLKLQNSGPDPAFFYNLILAFEAEGTKALVKTDVDKELMRSIFAYVELWFPRNDPGLLSLYFSSSLEYIQPCREK